MPKRITLKYLSDWLNKQIEPRAPGFRVVSAESINRNYQSEIFIYRIVLTISNGTISHNIYSTYSCKDLQEHIARYGYTLVLKSKYNNLFDSTIELSKNA